MTTNTPRPNAHFNDEDSNTSANPPSTACCSARLSRRNMLRGASAWPRWAARRLTGCATSGPVAPVQARLGFKPVAKSMADAGDRARGLHRTGHLRAGRPADRPACPPSRTTAPTPTSTTAPATTTTAWNGSAWTHRASPRDSFTARPAGHEPRSHHRRKALLLLHPRQRRHLHPAPPGGRSRQGTHDPRPVRGRSADRRQGAGPTSPPRPSTAASPP